MNFKRIGGIGIFLLAFLVFVLPAQQGDVVKKGSISLGGVYAASSLGYAYEYSIIYLDEPLSITDDVIRKGKPGFNVSAGYYIAPKIELFVGISSMKTGGQEGTVWISIPSDYYYDEIATDTDVQDRNASHTDLMFGGKYHFAPFSKVDPYFGIGGCYASASLQFMNDVIFDNLYDSELRHSVRITEVDLVKMKANALGGFAMGGFEIGIGPRLALFAEGLYKFAKKTVIHPFSSNIDEPEDIEMDMGGFVGCAGLKLRF